MDPYVTATSLRCLKKICIPLAINRSHVDDAIDIISIIIIICLKRIIFSKWKIMCIIYVTAIICIIVLYE
jgi:hypothetical protein